MIVGLPRPHPESAIQIGGLPTNAALALEGSQGLAVCDTDPLKLHYMWCLWQIGETAEHDWRLELAASRRAISEGRIGFADSYVISRIDPKIARERARADRTRQRRNFELHARLQPSLLDWYTALESALPGRVQMTLPPTMPALASRGRRYDLAAFDRLIEALPPRSDVTNA